MTSNTTTEEPGHYQKSTQYDLGDLSIVVSGEDTVLFPLKLRRKVNVEVTTSDTTTKNYDSKLLKPLFPYPGKNISFDSVENEKALGAFAENVIYDSCKELFPDSSAYNKMAQYVLKFGKALKEGLVEVTQVNRIPIDTDTIIDRIENGYSAPVVKK